MIGQLSQSLMVEITTLINSQTDILLQSGNVIFDTQFDNQDMTAHNMPLIILSINDSPDSGQMSGGATRDEYSLSMKIYNYEPNSEFTEDLGYSTGLMDILDIIKRHFLFGKWITNEFTTFTNDYSFRMTFNGIHRAEHLQHSHGIIPGYIINWDTVSIDRSTSFTIYTDLEIINDIPLAPYLTVIPNTINLERFAGSHEHIEITSNVSWVVSLSKTWLTSDFMSGNRNNIITITGHENTTGLDRTATVTVYNLGVVSQVIDVFQAGT